MESLRQAWSKSKVFRFILILALVWFVIRLVFQIVYASGLLPDITGSSGLPEDLPVYMGAAQSFQLRQGIYPQDLSNTTAEYPYSPPFAMLSAVLLWLPGQWVAVLATLMSVIACILIYTQWLQIFQRLKLDCRPGTNGLDHPGLVDLFGLLGRYRLSQCRHHRCAGSHVIDQVHPGRTPGLGSASG